jgi:death-on-curing protein
MTHFITTDEVVMMHEILIQKFGGSKGLRDRNQLEAAMLRPQSGYYTDTIHQAAALFESLLMNHPFVDGNKRVAFAVTDVFLRLNGYRLKTHSRDVYPMIIGFLKNTSLQTSDIDRWLRGIVVNDSPKK